MQWPALSFNGDWWGTQMRYCSPFIKLTLHIRKLNEFRGDSISVNYTMSWYFKPGGGLIALTLCPDCPYPAGLGCCVGIIWSRKQCGSGFCYYIFAHTLQASVSQGISWDYGGWTSDTVGGDCRHTVRLSALIYCTLRHLTDWSNGAKSLDFVDAIMRSEKCFRFIIRLQ